MAALLFAACLYCAPAAAEAQNHGRTYVAAAGGYRGAYLGSLTGLTLANGDPVGFTVGLLRDRLCACARLQACG